jgi:hypothetical protein
MLKQLGMNSSFYSKTQFDSCVLAFPVCCKTIIFHDRLMGQSEELFLKEIILIN